MKKWLVKSEPTVFSFQQLQQERKAVWDGVRNYAARNNLRLMQKNDLVLFYHSNVGMEIVGIAKVSKTAFQDPTTQEDWSAVEIVPVKALHLPVSLKTIKSDPQLQQIGLIKQSRLSVMPISEEEFSHLLQISGTAI